MFITRLPMEELNFPIKQTRFQSIEVPVIMQTNNGPCFLIALMNALILRRLSTDDVLDLPSQSTAELDSFIQRLKDSKFLPEIELINLLGGIVFESETFIEKDEMVKVLPKLNAGLNLELDLDSIIVNSFYDLTSPINQLLQMFNIKLYHGFIIDPILDISAGGDSSFDHFQDLMVGLTSDDPEGKLPKLQQFFQEYPTQLTPFGLKQLDDLIPYGEIGIFFRNDHYTTFLKIDKFYILVTDAGLMEVGDAMWQELSINDDSDFVSNNFNIIQLNESQLDEIKSRTTEPGHDMDLEMVRKLQNEEDELHAKKLHLELNQKPKSHQPSPKPKFSTIKQSSKEVNKLKSKKKDRMNNKKCIIM